MTSDNGITVKMSEADFKKLPLDDKLVILYKGIEGLGTCMRSLQSDGCAWGKKRDSHLHRKTISLAIIAGSVAGFFGGWIKGVR